MSTSYEATRRLIATSPPRSGRRVLTARPDSNMPRRSPPANWGDGGKAVAASRELEPRTLAVCPCDLDQGESVVSLCEKGGNQRRQPVSPTLMRHLVAHAAERGAPVDGPLFSYKNGSPIGGRRYNYRWRRVGEHLPGRHEGRDRPIDQAHHAQVGGTRVYGYAVARAYAGHTEHGGGGRRNDHHLREGRNRRTRRRVGRPDRRATPAHRPRRRHGSDCLTGSDETEPGRPVVDTRGVRH